MYNSIQDTLIIGKKVIYLPSCHSTNDIASEIVHAGLFSEGTVVITDNQLKGRGQRGTAWQANPGENLTFSIILSPDFLPIQDQFLISQMAALSVQAYLKSYLTDVWIKWPNDVLVGIRKICGMLIENSIQGSKITSSVLGIGVNINQLYKKNDRVTSLGSEVNRSFTLGDEFAKLIKFIDAHYLQLKSQATNNKIGQAYLDGLYGYNSEVRLSYQGKVLNGKVVKVTRHGRLVLSISGQEELLEVGLKEISWILE